MPPPDAKTPAVIPKRKRVAGNSSSILKKGSIPLQKHKMPHKNAGEKSADDRRTGKAKSEEITLSSVSKQNIF